MKDPRLPVWPPIVALSPLVLNDLNVNDSELVGPVRSQSALAVPDVVSVRPVDTNVQRFVESFIVIDSAPEVSENVITVLILSPAKIVSPTESAPSPML